MNRLPPNTDTVTDKKILGIRVTDCYILLIAAFLLFFLGWQWNVAFSAWLAPLLLIRFYRSQEKWTTTLVAIPILYLPLWYSIFGLWPLMSTLTIMAIAFLRLIPFLFALYLDRFFAKRLSGAARLLVYPFAFVLADFVLAMAPGATTFSPGATQFGLTSLIQVTSITGIWGITFLTCWFATVGNELWEKKFDLRAAMKPVCTFGLVITLIVFVGSVRISKFRPADETVRIGAVAMEFDSPYWAEVKKGNPREGKAVNAPGFSRLIDDLYLKSEGAIAQGSKIVFWAEGNAPVYEDDEAEFVDRAKAFALKHNIYFAPGMLVLHYGQKYGENKIIMINPEGEIIFEYEKTKTPKKTNSDGVLRFVDTEFGRISASVCFDMDYPEFARQLKDVDIMLVPSWDKEGIKPFHTEVSAFRAVENGFSSVRQVVTGSSMAVDYQGNVLAYQDYFAVDDATMVVDVPTKGAQTLYNYLGDWLIYACGVGLAWCVFVGRGRRKS